MNAAQAHHLSSAHQTPMARKKPQVARKALGEHRVCLTYLDSKVTYL